MQTATAPSHPHPENMHISTNSQKHATETHHQGTAGWRRWARGRPWVPARRRQGRRKPPTSCGPTQRHQFHTLQVRAVGGERGMGLGGGKEGSMHMMRWGTQGEPQLTFYVSVLIHQKLVRDSKYCWGTRYAWVLEMGGQRRILLLPWLPRPYTDLHLILDPIIHLPLDPTHTQHGSDS